MKGPRASLPRHAIRAVEQLRADIGIPLRLRDIGVKEDMLSGFAAKDGKVLWTMPTFKGDSYDIAPTPIASHCG